MKRTNTRTAKTARNKTVAARGKAPPSAKGATAKAGSRTAASAKGTRKAARTKAAATPRAKGVTTTAAKRRAAPRSRALVADRAHVYKMLKGFSTVMLVTIDGAGEGAMMRARPMAVAALAVDCTLTFVTSVTTPKVGEAEQVPQANVIAQSRSTYLSLRGRTEIVRDRARIESAWKPAYKVYFPDGLDSPDLCLMVFHPDEAELWDMSGARGLKFLFDAARSLLTGEAPTPDREQHTRVDMTSA